MDIEIKVKIGEQEVSMEEARKIYEALKGIFEKKAAPEPGNFRDIFKDYEKGKPNLPPSNRFTRTKCGPTGPGVRITHSIVTQLRPQKFQITGPRFFFDFRPWRCGQYLGGPLVS